MVRKIISGGQTGADRAALDVALSLGYEIGGWVPRGRKAEGGPIPERYTGLVETESDKYPPRTKLNVQDSDATLMLSYGEPSTGTALTVRIAESLDKPHLVLNLDQLSISEAVTRVSSWLSDINPSVLNVAGSRASTEPRIYAATFDVLNSALSAEV